MYIMCVFVHFWKDFRCLWQPSSTYFAFPLWPKRGAVSYSFLFPLRGERKDPSSLFCPRGQEHFLLPTKREEGSSLFPPPSRGVEGSSLYPLLSKREEGSSLSPLPLKRQEGRSLFPPPSRREAPSSLFPPLKGKSPGHFLFCRLPTLWQVSKSDPLGVRRWHAAGVFDNFHD